MIFFDNAASTPVKKEVLDEMLPYFSDAFVNASGISDLAISNRKAIDLARQRVADLIHCDQKEIFFTSGGTESDNWALKGVIDALDPTKKPHIITSKIEHHAILHTCEYLEKKGVRVTYLNVDEDGIIDLKELEDSICEDTVLISIMFANNEIGTIEPIKEIGEIAKKHNILFHTDAVQAVGQVDIDVNELNIDMLSMSGHKIYGPKGIGALYIRKGTKIKSFMHGGMQENSKRAGTENTPGIVGFGMAAKLIKENNHSEQLIKIRDFLIDEIEKNVPDVILNGHRTKRLPNNVNFSIKKIEGESILLLLNFNGIVASSGSACTSGSLDPSHVLLAIGLPHEVAHGSLRISLADYNTLDEAKHLVEVLPGIVEKLRFMSPLK